jgi:hypothetical protein
MANIVNPPARINRNTAADGDFLWKQDFEVLYNNDVALEQAIQQASQDYTAGDGISIDPSTKTISVNTGTGIKKDDEGLSVNIEGKNIDVQYAEGKYTLSAFDSQKAFNELGEYAKAIHDELEEAEQRFITSDNVTQENTQYVYTTSGWKAMMVVGCSLLHSFESKLMSLKYEDMLEFLINGMLRSEFFMKENEDNLEDYFMNIKISRKLTRTIESEYAQEKMMNEIKSKKK